ncbi:MAG: LysR family transcriptional regulator [Gammaproteobacteria bacterium]|nr:LysR family transcriptional regulator [Gammaproteobacteria bacterium]
MFNGLTLECFVAVSDTASFTKAADKVARTQSAVSQQISQLEKQLDCQLFYRGKHLSLTTEGEILLSYARKIVQLNREAIDRFRSPELQGEVRFGLPEDFASVFLSDVLSEYTRLHPRMMLLIECDLTVNLFERFKNKEFDLVLVKMNRPEDFPNGIDVWSEALEWVGDQSLFDNKDQPLPLVVSPTPCVYRARAIETLNKLNRKWHVVFSSPSYAGTIAAVEAGMGITVLPRNMVPSSLPIIRTEDNQQKLTDTHISLLKHDENNLAVNDLEAFVDAKLKP